MKKTFILALSLFIFQLHASLVGPLIDLFVKSSKESISAGLTKTKSSLSVSAVADSLDVLREINGGREFSNPDQIRLIFNTSTTDDELTVAIKQKSLDILAKNAIDISKSESEELLNNALYLAWKSGKGKYSKLVYACSYCPNAKGDIPKFRIIENASVKAINQDIPVNKAGKIAYIETKLRKLAPQGKKMNSTETAQFNKSIKSKMEYILARRTTDEEIHRFALYLGLFEKQNVSKEHTAFLQELHKFYSFNGDPRYFQDSFDNTLYLLATNPEIYDDAEQLIGLTKVLKRANSMPPNTKNRGQAFFDSMEELIEEEKDAARKSEMVTAFEEFKKRNCWKLR